jgi:type IV protein arginine methyltransferase
MAPWRSAQGDEEASDRKINDIIHAASRHDTKGLERLIGACAFAECNAVDVQDPSTGNTPLHAAIQSCALPQYGTADKCESNAEEAAAATVRFLLENGAIWNQLNHEDMTPGCVANQSGPDTLYQMMVDAGVRAEMLLNKLDEYDQLRDDDEQDEDEESTNLTGDSETQTEGPDIVVTRLDHITDVPISTKERPSKEDVSSTTYLSSTLSMTDSKILDEQQNGVMMEWEKDIMSKSTDAILSSPGLRVLNIGFGMGIIDSLIQSHANRPAEHHIIEAHPDVLKAMESKGWPDKPGVFIHAGRWQDVLQTMVDDNLVFDAIYYDTFAESYKDFKDFFSEQVLGLLDTAGRWSYFNGMGADRQISYDVYQKIVEIDLYEAGYDVEWEEVALPDLGQEWEGIRRKYWNVEKYRLPVCKFLD